MDTYKLTVRFAGVHARSEHPADVRGFSFDDVKQNAIDLLERIEDGRGERVADARLVKYAPWGNTGVFYRISDAAHRPGPRHWVGPMVGA